MNDNTKKILGWSAGIVVGIFVIFLWPHTSSWDGEGTINVFPEDATAKNYRLDATMTVTRHKQGWMHKYDEYTDIRGSWPGGGDFNVEDCVVRDKATSDCSNQDGKMYRVEVQTAPDPPEDNGSSSDY